MSTQTTVDTEVSVGELIEQYEENVLYNSWEMLDSRCRNSQARQSLVAMGVPVLEHVVSHLRSKDYDEVDNKCVAYAWGYFISDLLKETCHRKYPTFAMTDWRAWVEWAETVT